MFNRSESKVALPPPLGRRFRVLEVLAQGPTGLRVHASPLGGGPAVELRVLVVPGAYRHALVERFRDELPRVRALGHAGLQRVLDSGHTRDGRPWLTCEPALRSLRQVLDTDGRLPPQVALELVRCVAEALDALHRAGLVHRDVRPAHVGSASTGRRCSAGSASRGTSAPATTGRGRRPGTHRRRPATPRPSSWKAKAP